MAMRGSGREVEARSTGRRTKHFSLFNRYSTDNVRVAAYGDPAQRGLSRHHQSYHSSTRFNTLNYKAQVQQMGETPLCQTVLQLPALQLLSSGHVW
jgi:hypothetical protein